jgi:hypothetical protein
LEKLSPLYGYSEVLSIQECRVFKVKTTLIKILIGFSWIFFQKFQMLTVVENSKDCWTNVLFKVAEDVVHRIFDFLLSHEWDEHEKLEKDLITECFVKGRSKGKFISQENLGGKIKMNKVIYKGVLSTGRLLLDLWYTDQNSPIDNSFSINFSFLQLETKTSFYRHLAIYGFHLV